MGKHQDNSDDDELDEAEFIVEKILDRKVVNGEVYYFLKWKGFGDTENTWVSQRDSLERNILVYLQEPEMNLDCPELIADYHKRSKKSLESNELSDSNKRAPQDAATNDAMKKAKRANDFGYGRGLEIEKILGATDVYGELMFL